MRRLLALAVPIALMMGTGCVAHVHGPAHYAPVDVIEYSYSGDHPIPDDFGGGWCPYSHMHVHEYQPTTTYYVYSDNAYYYQGPSVVWYWDDHPHAHGGLCHLRGRHSHDYYPTVGNLYRYERGRGYVWSRTHSASAGYSYVRPARPATPGNTYGGQRTPPSGTRWSTQPPRGASAGSGGHNQAPRGQSHDSNGGWGNRPASSGSPPPGRSASGSSTSSNSSGNGRSSPPAGRATRSTSSQDDDRQSNSSGRNTRGGSSSGSSSSSSGWGRGGNSGGSSNSGSSSSGGGWGRGGGSSGSSSNSGSPPSGRSGSSSGNGRWR